MSCNLPRLESIERTAFKNKQLDIECCDGIKHYIMQSFHRPDHALGGGWYYNDNFKKNEMGGVFLCHGIETKKENRETFESFNKDFNKQHDKVETIKGFLKSSYKIIYIHSEKNGTGKTYMSNALASQAIQIGFKIRHMTAVVLKEIFLQVVRGDLDSKRAYSEIVNKDLIVVDDFLKEGVTGQNFATYFLDLLDSFKGRIVITSQYPPGTVITAYGENTGNAIASRLSEALRIDFTGLGKDYRRKRN